MNYANVLLTVCMTGYIFSSCASNEKEKYKPASPQLKAVYDRSSEVKTLDLEKALSEEKKEVKLSDVGSSISYYIVGDANYPVTQAIALQDSDAFITFNKPRIYYRKPDTTSKRVGFKALDYKWSSDVNKCNLFIDKKTKRLYVALSGKDKFNKKDSVIAGQKIGVLAPWDSLLRRETFLEPEGVDSSFLIPASADRLLGFSSSGYALWHPANETYDWDGIMTFNMQGDTLCCLPLMTDQMNPDSINGKIYEKEFHTYYWDSEQQNMKFMIPKCDTLYELSNANTVTPLFAIERGSYKADNKAVIQTLFENNKAMFVGLDGKGRIPISNFTGNVDDFKPLLTDQVIYLKGQNKLINVARKGMVNDLDDGLPFWPDGQTEDCIYQIRKITELRETVKRTNSARQKKLLELLDNPKTRERDFVMIVVR